MRTLLALVLVATATLGASSTQAHEAPIRIGQVALHEVRLDETTVRQTLGEEALAVSESAPKGKRSVVLSVSVSERAVGRDAFECVVSGVVMDAKGGAVLGIVEGRAGTRAASPSSTLERGLLKTAARGALGQLPVVLR